MLNQAWGVPAAWTSTCLSFIAGELDVFLPGLVQLFSSVNRLVYFTCWQESLVCPWVNQPLPGPRLPHLFNWGGGWTENSEY